MEGPFPTSRSGSRVGARGKTSYDPSAWAEKKRTAVEWWRGAYGQILRTRKNFLEFFIVVDHVHIFALRLRELRS